MLHILFFGSDTNKPFQDGFSSEDVPYSSLPTLSKDVLRAMLPDVEINEISLHEGDACTVCLDIDNSELYHDVLQKKMVINNSCCTGLIPLMQRTVLLGDLN